MKNKLVFVCRSIFVLVGLTGCFGTKLISLDDSAITKKEQVLVHQDGGVYQLNNFEFRENHLTGNLMRSYLADLPKSKKMKYLDVYVEPGIQLLKENETSSYVEIPNSSILKIEKTRFRAEYVIFVIPIWLIGGMTIYYLGALIG